MNLYEYFLELINKARITKSIEMLENIKKVIDYTPIKLFRNDNCSLSDMVDLTKLIEEYISIIEKDN